MIDSALPYVVSVCIGAILGWAVHRWCMCQHRFDDGTDRYEIVPYRADSDKMGINRKTVYRCQKESCPAEETDTSCVKVVDRGSFEDAIDECDTYHGSE